jgi:hypothetical protein
MLKLPFSKAAESFTFGAAGSKGCTNGGTEVVLIKGAVIDSCQVITIQFTRFTSTQNEGYVQSLVDHVAPQA